MAAAKLHVKEDHHQRKTLGGAGLDAPFLVLLLVLLAVGLTMLYSASYAQSEYDTGYTVTTRYLQKQAGSGVIGLAVMFFVSKLSPDFWLKIAWPLYGVSVALLLSVLLFGQSVNGAKRWISIAGVQFQPSEIAKYALILTLGWYYSKYHDKAFDDRNLKTSNIYGTMVPLGFTLFICLLVMLEKHLSGIIIIGCIGVMIMFASGIRLKLLGLMGCCGVLGVLAIAFFTDYTKRRIDIWRNPAAYPQDGGWQTLQGMRAIGSGGFFGLGLGNSRQKFSYVSQPQNDFIYTIVCEELGFIGAMAVIVLFALLVWRGVVIGLRAPDRFSQLVAMGISFKVALQVILNIAVVTNSIPNTGISLPFFSYGGTAMVVQLVEMGTLLAISRYTLEKK